MIEVEEIGTIPSGAEPLPIYRLSGKRVGRYPQWWKRLFDDPLDASVWRRWLDHAGSFIAEDGTEVLMSEPYNLDPDAVRDLLAFCDQHDLDFHIDGLTQHYPTRTFRVRVWPNKRKTIQ